MKKDMPLEGLRWSRDSGSALYDTPQNGRSRTGWGGPQARALFKPVAAFLRAAWLRTAAGSSGAALAGVAALFCAA